MRRFSVFSFLILFVLDCVPQYAQSSVSPVAFSESQDVIPAFSAAGPITLPVMRRLIDVNYANGKKERRDLLVVYAPQGGHYFWHDSLQNSPNDTSGGWMTSFKSGSSGIYVTPDSVVEFLGGSNVIEHRTKATSLVNAQSSAIDEAQRNLLATQRIRDRLGAKIVPLMDAPPLVGFEKSPSWTNRLPGFKPIPPNFLCVSYGGPGQGPCPHGTLVVSISKQGGNWRLVLRNRWDVEVILDPSFNAVSTKQLTELPK